MANLTNKPNLANPVHLLAFGFGSGLAPKAPGTFGSLAALALYLPLSMLPVGWYLAVLVLSIIVGLWVCDQTARDLGVHDHGGIVWDEFAGLWLTLAATPSGWQWPLIGFALFRLFDIWKPWPISWLDQNVKGGLGIMIDDLAAGVLAWGMLQLIYMA